MTFPSWSVVATVKEPTAILLSFCAHYLSLGASGIHLFLDAPDPAFQELAAQKPRLHITVCDEAYWRDAHGIARPWDVRDRQVLNATLAYHSTPSEWLLHVDADEFLVRKPEVMQMLASVPDRVLAVSLQNAEQVVLRGTRPRNVLRGFFRKPFDEDDVLSAKRIYGKGAAFLTRGFSAYAVGKSFYRVGAGLQMGLHQPRPRTIWYDPGNPARVWFHRVGLLHFDGFSRTHWVHKMTAKLNMEGQVKRGHSSGRTAQVDHVAVQGLDPERLFDMTRTVTPGQLLALAMQKKILPVRFRIEPALRQEWPGVKVDLSPAAIDAALGYTQN